MNFLYTLYVVPFVLSFIITIICSNILYNIVKKKVNEKYLDCYKMPIKETAIFCSIPILNMFIIIAIPFFTIYELGSKSYIGERRKIQNDCIAILQKYDKEGIINYSKLLQVLKDDTCEYYEIIDEALYSLAEILKSNNYEFLNEDDLTNGVNESLIKFNTLFEELVSNDNSMKFRKLELNNYNKLLDSVIKDVREQKSIFNKAI